MIPTSEARPQEPLVIGGIGLYACENAMAIEGTTPSASARARAERVAQLSRSLVQISPQNMKADPNKGTPAIDLTLSESLCWLVISTSLTAPFPLLLLTCRTRRPRSTGSRAKLGVFRELDPCSKKAAGLVHFLHPFICIYIYSACKVP